LSFLCLLRIANRRAPSVKAAPLYLDSARIDLLEGRQEGNPKAPASRIKVEGHPGAEGANQ
jgi:hypothetical protein